MAKENPYEIVSIEVENNKKLLSELNTDHIPLKLNKKERIYYLSGDFKDDIFHIGILFTNQRIFLFDSVKNSKLYNGENCRFSIAGNPIIIDVMAVADMPNIIHYSKIFNTKTLLLKLIDNEDLRIRLPEKEMEIKVEFLAATNTDKMFIDTWHDTEFIEDALECQYPGLHDTGYNDDQINIQQDSEQTFKRKAISEEVKRYVWRRDEGKCVYCGSRINLEFDHIIPVSKGGSNTARNIQLLCQNCNRHKSDSI